MNWLNYLKAICATIGFVVILTIIWAELNWENEFMIGWLSCMAWYIMVYEYRLKS